MTFPPFSPRVSRVPLIVLATSSTLLLNSCQLFSKKANATDSTLSSTLAQPTAKSPATETGLTNLPSPGPIDLTSLENIEITEQTKENPSSPKKLFNPFRAPDATQALVGESEANRIAISPSLKKMTEQPDEDQGTLVARPPKTTP